jgi:hypothetical protein
MNTAVCDAKEIHFSTQRSRGRGGSPSFLKARQGWPICRNQNQSIFELSSAAIYSVHPKMPRLMELGIFLLGGFLQQRYRAYGAKRKSRPGFPQRLWYYSRQFVLLHHGAEESCNTKDRPLDPIQPLSTLITLFRD